MEQKVALIGAGSYVFGFSVLYGMLFEYGMGGSETALMDIDGEAAELMARVGRRLAEDTETQAKIVATTDLEEAVSGADFVILSAAFELVRRWEMDWEIAQRYGLKQTLGENGGPGGLSYTLRQVPLTLNVCRAMREHCPDAILLNTANPVPRTTLAAIKYGGVKAVGFCYGTAYMREELENVIGVPADRMVVVVAGLNHFSWLLRVWDKATGEDLYPRVRQAGAEGALAESAVEEDLYTRVRQERAEGAFAKSPLREKLLRTTGYLPGLDDMHFGEYFAFDEEVGRSVRGCPHHSTPEKSEQRRRLMEDIAAGGVPWQGAGRCCERPWDVIHALQRDTEMDNRGVRIEFNGLNLLNGGCIENLPEDVVVEIPAVADSEGVRGVPVGSLPEPVAAYCQPAARVQSLAVEAGVTGDREKAIEALRSDPAMSDPSVAEQVVDDILAAHADILPQFA